MSYSKVVSIQGLRILSQLKKGIFADVMNLYKMMLYWVTVGPKSGSLCLH